MGTTVHTLHVLLAGVWLGGVVFTTVVVSPALKAMKWDEAERVSVRSGIGKQYAKVGTINLILLAVSAVVDGALRGFGSIFYVEYVLLVMLCALVAAHGAYFGRRLAKLAAAERLASSAEQAQTFAEQRRRLQKLSLIVSRMDLAVSTAVVVLAINV